MILTAFWLTTFEPVALHGPNGQVIYVNPALVTSVREPQGLERGHWTQGTRCLVIMVNNRMITVREPCADVLIKLQRTRP